MQFDHETSWTSGWLSMPAVGSRQTRKLCRSRELRQLMARVWPS